jgi:hypothetical protein
MKKLLLFLLFCAPAINAANIYVAQASAGGNTGADCADARIVSSLVSGDYVAGNVIHLCGTITGTTNTSILTVGGNGSSGTPITILWETGAILQEAFCPASGGCLNLNSHTFITVDGGSNGILQNTANGTGLANQVASTLIGNPGSNTTVKNLSLLNVYQHTNGDASGGTTYGILARGNSNFTVGPNNTFTQADVGLLYEWNGGESNLIVTGNNWSGINQDIEMGPTATSAAFTNVQIYHNTASNWVNWDEPGNTYHHNFFHPFTNLVGASLSGTLQVYDNISGGNMGSHATSMVFIENNDAGAGGTMGPWYIFNNTFDKTNANVPTSSGIVAIMALNGFLYNNSFRDAGGTGANAYVSFHLYGASTGWTMTNNIFQGGAYMVYDESSSVTGNKNVYYNSPSGTPWVRGASFISTIGAWRTACSCDAASVTTNPLLNTNFTLQAGSSATGLGSNLTGTGITALNSDLAGIARPSGVTAWDTGALQFGAVTTPPTNLQIILLSSFLQNPNAGAACTAFNTPGNRIVTVASKPKGVRR